MYCKQQRVVDLLCYFSKICLFKEKEYVKHIPVFNKILLTLLLNN